MTTIIKSLAIGENRAIDEINLKEAQRELFDIVEQVKAEDKRIILSENGEQKAVIISVEAFSFLQKMIDKIEDEIDIAEAEKILGETKPKDYVSLEQIKQELGCQ